MNPKGYWAFKINGILIGASDVNFCREECIGIVDTGEPGLIAPSSPKLERLLYASRSEKSDVIICDDYSKVNFPSKDFLNAHSKSGAYGFLVQGDLF